MKIILNTPQVLRLLKLIQDENPDTQISLYRLALEINKILDKSTGTTNEECNNNHTISSNRFSRNNHLK
jgi:hypothetical protein